MKQKKIKTQFKKIQPTVIDEGKKKAPWLMIVGLSLIAIGYFGFKKISNQESVTPIQNETILAQSLPAGWKVIEEKTNGLEIKLEKSNDETIKPIVVFIKSTTEEADTKAYVDKLVKGLKSAIPSLRVESDTESIASGTYRRDFSYSYFAGKDKISVRQQITIDGNQVSTLTASYSANTKDENLKSEIEIIFGNLE